MKRSKDLVKPLLEYSGLKINLDLKKTANKIEKLSRVSQNPNPFHLTEKAAPNIKPDKRKCPKLLYLFPFKKNRTAVNPKREKNTFIKPKRESTSRDPSSIKKRATSRAKCLSLYNSSASL